MRPDQYKITELIPQREPMVMIDKLIYADEKSAKGILFIRESNMFIHQNKLSEAALIEFMAQTAAAYTGYKNLTGNKPIKEGYIGAVKNLVIDKLPGINTEIAAEITVDNEIVGFTIISAKVISGSEIIASCEIRIMG